jgi:CRP-like cAMP-binding protein
MMLDRRSREQRIALRVPGDVVGEMAFVDGRPRSASAMAVGPVTAQRVPRDGFSRFFDEFPDAYHHLLRTVIDRLRASDSRQVEVGFEVEARLAAALCQLATTCSDDGRESLIVRHTQRELGQMIGASTVSVHRALRKLAGRDCIRTEYREIVLLDFEALAAIAGPRTTLHRLM